MKRLVVAILVLVSALGPTLPALALSGPEEHSVLYDSVWYRPGGRAGSCNGSISTTVLDQPIVDAIAKLRDVYQQAGQLDDVPWQVLAAIHYREGSNNPLQDLQAGNPIGKGGSQYSSQGPQPDIQTSANNAGKELQSKALSGIFKKPITATNPDPELIKDALFGYNGRSSAYAAQAATYGFDPVKQPYEGSPYVMNRADAARQHMGMIHKDFQGITPPPDTKFGTFVVYSALIGASSCGGLSGNKILDVAQQELQLHLVGTGPLQNSGPVCKYQGSACGEQWCADFTSWVYNQAGVPFHPADADGWRIAGTVSMWAWFAKYGVRVHNPGSSTNDKLPSDLDGASNPPQVGDVAYFDHGHVGIVEKVDGGTLYTIEGNSGPSVAEIRYNNYLKNPDLGGWGRTK